MFCHNIGNCVDFQLPIRTKDNIFQISPSYQQNWLL